MPAAVAIARSRSGGAIVDIVFSVPETNSDGSRPAIGPGRRLRDYRARANHRDQILKHGDEGRRALAMKAPREPG